MVFGKVAFHIKERKLFYMKKHIWAADFMFLRMKFFEKKDIDNLFPKFVYSAAVPNRI
jgi:hypothetical protein